jgi:hypothetical protein
MHINKPEWLLVDAIKQSKGSHFYSLKTNMAVSFQQEIWK